MGCSLMCENETNRARLFGAENVTRYPKDGIADHVVHGADTSTPTAPAPRGRCATASPCRAEGRPRSACACRRRARAWTPPGAGRRGITEGDNMITLQVQGRIGRIDAGVSVSAVHVFYT